MKIIYKKIIMILLGIVIFIPIWIKMYMISNLFIVSLICTILSLYIIYVLTSLIEYTIVDKLKIVRVRRLVIYPFIYERKVSFRPIKLFYNRELIQDVIPQNIVYEYNSSNLSKMYSKFKAIRFIREVSMLVAYLLVSIIVVYRSDINTLFVYILSYLGCYVFSYMQVGLIYKGNKRIVLNNNIKRDILAGNFNHCINVNEYWKYFNEMLLEYENRYDLLMIVENYIYAAIFYDDIVVTAKRLEEIILFLQANKQYYYTKLNKVLVLIGLAGNMNNNQDYINLAIRLLGDDINNDYHDFLIGKRRMVDIKSIIEMGKQDIFTSKRLVEMRIDAYCGYIIKQDYI